MLLLALAVVPARSAYIAHYHSESIDDEYHLVRGVRYLRGELGKTPLNDPVLGATVMALPVWAEGAVPNKGKDAHKFGLVLHGQKHASAETLLLLVALWKSVLYVPFVALAFAWVRRTYNAAAGWAAAIILLIEPTIGAHVQPAALDVLGFEMIVLACWCWWRYFERPGWGRLTAAAVLSSAAMLTKHTAIVVPAVAAIYWVVFQIRRWKLKPRPEAANVAAIADSSERPDPHRLDYATPRPGRTFGIPRDMIHAAAAVAIALVALYVLSIDSSHFPASYYWRSMQEAMHHGEGGHPSWFLGHRNDAGDWRYYFVVAAYKVPLPLMAWIALGVASLAFVRPRFAELALFVPMLLLGGLVIAGGINIGFRHAIPAYGLLLMLSTRWLLIDGAAIRVGAVALLAATTLDVARFGPDLLSYLNYPRRQPWMTINDSNLDWGQGLKQIRAWIDANPKMIGGRPVWVRAFGLSYSIAPEHYLGDRATRVRRNGPAPTSGLLIIGPAHVVGLFEDDPERFAFLRGREPDAIIGHSNLVFDLDR